MTVTYDPQALPGGVRVAMLAVLLALVATLTSCGYTQVQNSPDDEPVYEDTYFEEEDPYPPDGFPALDPYGSWVRVDEFGWAWRPDVYSDWRPYYYGHWNWTSWGWTWVSYEPFGWAAYHYGNWVIDPYWGWIWFPAYDWYANRVSWIVYDDYICWAPMPIHGYMIGDPWMYEYESVWNIATVNDFQSPFVGDYRVRNFRPTVYKQASRVIYKAPAVGFIAQRSGQTVTTITMETRPVTGGKQGLKKLKVPSEASLRMREMRTRANKEIYGKRDGTTRRTRATGGDRKPPIITTPNDGSERKGKSSSKPNKQEPNAGKQKKKPESKARSGRKPKRSKDKKEKDDRN